VLAFASKFIFKGVVINNEFSRRSGEKLLSNRQGKTQQSFLKLFV
jgi:hypothetical protein